MNSGKSIDHLIVKGLGICTALLGGIFLVQLPSMYKSEVDFHSNAISATGTVIETREKKHHLIPRDYLIIFDHRGRKLFAPYPHPATLMVGTSAKC